MRKVLRGIGYVVAGLALLIVVVLVIGALLPVEHVASVTAVYGESPVRVWRAINDYEAFPSWRSGVDRVEASDFADGSSGWIEHGAAGSMPLAVDASEPPRRLVLRIASQDLPFGGTWTYVVEPEGGGARLTITEDGSVTNVLFRFMSRFVFGHTATMEGYLVDLGRHFGEQTEPVVLQR